MAYSRSEVIRKMMSLSTTLNRHLLKCIVFYDTRDLHVWCEEVRNHLWVPKDLLLAGKNKPPTLQEVEQYLFNVDAFCRVESIARGLQDIESLFPKRLQKVRYYREFAEKVQPALELTYSEILKLVYASEDIHVTKTLSSWFKKHHVDYD